MKLLRYRGAALAFSAAFGLMISATIALGAGMVIILVPRVGPILATLITFVGFGLGSYCCATLGKRLL